MHPQPQLERTAWYSLVSTTTWSMALALRVTLMHGSSGLVLACLARYGAEPYYINQAYWWSLLLLAVQHFDMCLWDASVTGDHEIIIVWPCCCWQKSNINTVVVWPEITLSDAVSVFFFVIQIRAVKKAFGEVNRKKGCDFTVGFNAKASL
jgi:hypothetical protein